MHGYANPARFLKIARPATGWLFGIGLLLLLAGVWGGLLMTPPDYLQGETVRILYIHVPAAWLGMAGWASIAAASISQLVWRHPLAAVAGRAIAPAGATFAALCLATGSIWGRPTWGTWWEWDGRLTSMLILFFLYLGYIALASAERERGGEGRMAALFGVVGAVNLPNHSLFGDVVADASSGPIDQHRRRLLYRSGIAVAAAAHHGRLYRHFRSGRADANAGGARAAEDGSAPAPERRRMNQWAFVIVAYGIILLATVGLVLLLVIDARRRGSR